MALVVMDGGAARELHGVEILKLGPPKLEPGPLEYRAGRGKRTQRTPVAVLHGRNRLKKSPPLVGLIHD